MPHPVSCVTLLAVLAAASAGAHAQSAPAAAAASQPAVAERAQRDADKVFQMILQHADKPRRVVREEKAAPPPALPVPAVPVRAAARTQPAGVKATAEAQPAEAATAKSVTPSAPVSEPLQAAPQTPTAAVGPAQTAAVAVAPAAPAPAPATVVAPRSTKLELVSSVEPEFPARLVRDLGHGSVLVNFEVSPDGTVSRTEVVRSSHRGLNAAAQTAVAAWRFKPLVEGRPGVVELKFE